MSLSEKDQEQARVNLFYAKARCELPRRIDVYGITYDLWMNKCKFGAYNLCYYSISPGGNVDSNNKLFGRTYSHKSAINEIIDDYKEVMSGLPYTVVELPEHKEPETPFELSEKDYIKAKELIEVYERHQLHKQKLAFVPEIEDNMVLEYQDWTGRWYRLDKDLLINPYFDPRKLRVRSIN